MSRTALALAFSPTAWPPIPSATTKPCPRAYHSAEAPAGLAGRRPGGMRPACQLSHRCRPEAEGTRMTSPRTLRWAVLFAAAAATGCGGVSRRFVIESNVPNAQVYIDDKPVGPAPAHAQF